MTPPVLPAKLATRTLRAGTILYRAHSVGLGAVFFGPGAGEPPKYRFDSPDGGYRVCYLGLNEEAAFIEGVIHAAIPRRIISQARLAARAISVIHVQQDIRAVRLYGRHMVGNGATATVAHGDDYSGLSHPWSKAIHGHSATADGILYMAKHDDSVMALALFDRAAHKVAAGSRHPLSGHDLRTLRLLDRYGIGLEP
jgi:RES domain